MESFSNYIDMLDLMIRPAFSVYDGKIETVNREAKYLLPDTAAPISDLISTGWEEYQALEAGTMYLTLTIAEHIYNTCVTRMDGHDIFVLEEPQSSPQLQALALAARELREPLAGIMLSADRLLPILAEKESPTAQQQAQLLNRSLYQMLRLIGNMSDAARYAGDPQSTMELRDAASILDTVFEKAAALLAENGTQVQFHGLQKPVFTLVDEEKLERAVYNLLSNAAKFAGASCTIHANLTHRGNKLYLTVSDNGNGIPQDLRSTVFSRYLRQPSLEDGLQGLGLGMVIVRSAAAAHGGTVLIEQPEGLGARVTMTIAVRTDKDGSFCSPRLRFDYAGERDHGLLELADTLPASLYDITKL